MSVTRQLLAAGYEITKFFAPQTHGQVIAVKEVSNGVRRAIKLFDIEDDTTVLCELDIMSRLRHPHIMPVVKLLTPINTTLADYVGLVMPLAQNTISDVRVSWDKKLLWFYKIATAIEFMHSNNILHLDIKHPNIVVLDGEPKLIDFGCSILVDDITVGKYHPTALVAMMYRAPEIFNGHRQYTASIDVWSFGMLMVTLLVMDIIAPAETDDQSYHTWLVDKFSTTKFVNKLLYLVPNDYRVIFSNIICDILRIDSAQRPTMKQICEHASFDAVRTPIIGNVRDITYSTKYHTDHGELLREFIKWVHQQLRRTKVKALFLAIDIFYRIAEDYSHDRALSSNILLTVLNIACEVIDEPTVSNIVGKDEKLVILHKLNGTLYHSPYYDEALTGDELLLVINEILYSSNPALYTTTDIRQWYCDKRLEVSVPKHPNKDISVAELLS